MVFGKNVRPLDEVEVFFMLSVGDDDDFELLMDGDGIKLWSNENFIQFLYIRMDFFCLWKRLEINVYLLFFSAVDIISYNLDRYSDTVSWISSRNGGTISFNSSNSGEVFRNLYKKSKVIFIVGSIIVFAVQFPAHFSTYLWHNACLAVSRFDGSIARRTLTRSFASAGVSANSSSKLGLELIDLLDWFNKAEPNPFPTDFKSLSLGCGNADTMHSIFKKATKKNNRHFFFALLVSFRVKLFSTWLIVQLPGNSGLPLHISPRIQPRDHISIPFVYCLLAINISGARYHRVATSMKYENIIWLFCIWSLSSLKVNSPWQIRERVKKIHSLYILNRILSKWIHFSIYQRLPTTPYLYVLECELFEQTYNIHYTQFYSIYLRNPLSTPLHSRSNQMSDDFVTTNVLDQNRPAYIWLNNWI